MARNHQGLAAEAIHYMDLLLEISSDETTSLSEALSLDEEVRIENSENEDFVNHYENEFEEILEVYSSVIL